MEGKLRIIAIEADDKDHLTPIGDESDSASKIDKQGRLNPTFEPDEDDTADGNKRKTKAQAASIKGPAIVEDQVHDDHCSKRNAIKPVEPTAAAEPVKAASHSELEIKSEGHATPVDLTTDAAGISAGRAAINETHSSHKLSLLFSIFCFDREHRSFGRRGARPRSLEQ